MHAAMEFHSCVALAVGTAELGRGRRRLSAGLMLIGLSDCFACVCGCGHTHPQCTYRNTSNQQPATSDQRPTDRPTDRPTNQPTNQPTNKRTNEQTNKPTNKRTNERTNKRTNNNNPAMADFLTWRRGLSSRLFRVTWLVKPRVSQSNVQGGSPTSRRPNHQVRLLVARAGQPIGAPCNTSGQLLAGWRGRGVSSPPGPTPRRWRRWRRAAVAAGAGRAGGRRPS